MLTFLVVIYNRHFSDVATLATLLKQADMPRRQATLYIWDNSPAKFEQESLETLSALKEKFDRVDYHRSADNSKLSVLYNLVAKQSFLNGSNALTVLDHDSELAPDFFNKVNASLSGQMLVVPKVVSNRSNCIISPRFQASHSLTIRPAASSPVTFDTAGEVSSNDLFAVGSGLTISRELWRTGLRFEQSLSFYGIDTEYCRDYSLAHPTFVVADTFLLHDISSEGEEDAASKKWRFNSHMDYWVYQLRKHSKLPKWTVRPYVTLWRVLVSTKYFIRSVFPK